MNLRVAYTLLVLAAVAGIGGHALAAAANTERIVVIRDAHIVIGDGEEIERGSIVIIDGRIAVVGRSVDVPVTAEVIDAAGMTVMPGMVHARSRAGQRSYPRSGINAHFRAFDELVTEDFESEPFLRAGYTAVAVIPWGSGIPGTAAVLRTGGSEAVRVLSESAYLRILVSDAGERRTFTQALERAQAEIEKVVKAREEWEKKQAGGPEQAQPAGAARRGGPRPGGQAASDEEKPVEPPAEEKPQEPAKFEPPKIDPSLQPLVDLLEGKTSPPAMLEITSAADMLYLEQILKRFPKFPVERFFVDGGDVYLAAEALGARKALVLTSPLIRTLPNTSIRCNVPAEFVEAGCEIAIVPVGSAESTLSRVADLVRSGLDRKIAMRALTQGPAKMVGLEQRLGKIAEGFDADLVFLDGHPLDGISRVQRVMIFGEMAWEAAR